VKSEKDGAVSPTRTWLLAAGVGNLVFLYAPIVVLIVFSFNASRLSVSWSGWTLDWYRMLADDDPLWRSVRNSLVVGFCSTAVATVLGVAAAVALERRPFRWQGAAEQVLLLPLVIPEVMMGVAMMVFFAVVRMPFGLATIAIGHAAFNLPIVVLLVRARLRKLDPQLEEAAYDLGAAPWQAFRRVTWPLIRPAVLGAALLAFTVSLDDFVVTFFTAGPGATTLPLKVYSMIRSGVTPEINALSAMLVLVSMGLIACALLLQRKGGE
jgi:spermidine/putrescine transport system permease protein